MELGALICKPKNPICNQCPISKKCKSFENKDFELTKNNKKKIDKYFLLNKLAINKPEIPAPITAIFFINFSLSI